MISLQFVNVFPFLPVEVAHPVHSYFLRDFHLKQVRQRFYYSYICDGFTIFFTNGHLWFLCLYLRLFRKKLEYLPIIWWYTIIYVTDEIQHICWDISRFLILLWVRYSSDLCFQYFFYQCYTSKGWKIYDMNRVHRLARDVTWYDMIAKRCC